MTDPRNVAHDKKVQQEKKHHHEAISPDAEHAPQPGRKPHLKHSEAPAEVTAAASEAGSSPSTSTSE